jgi:hypothetical protein
MGNLLDLSRCGSSELEFKMNYSLSRINAEYTYLDRLPVMSSMLGSIKIQAEAVLVPVICCSLREMRQKRVVSVWIETYRQCRVVHGIHCIERGFCYELGCVIVRIWRDHGHTGCGIRDQLRFWIWEVLVEIFLEELFLFRWQRCKSKWRVVEI